MLPASVQAVALPTDVVLHVVQRVDRPDGSTVDVHYAHAASATAPLTATALTAGPAFPVQQPERAEVSVHLVPDDRALDAGAAVVIIDADWPALDAVTLHHLIDSAPPSPLLVAGPRGAAAWRMRQVPSRAVWLDHR